MATFKAPPSACEILPGQISQFEYDFRETTTAAEYEGDIAQGWRRFGMTFFRPVCEACRACTPIRVLVDEFAPNRSQRRAWQRNSGEVEIQRVEPTVTYRHLELFLAFHAARTEQKGWTPQTEISPIQYAESFLLHPFPTEEWQYLLDGSLCGVGYVDVLPDGLSAIYFFSDPAEHRRSLGVFNVLSLVERARELKLPYLYLGYYVPGSRSMSYKGTYRPAEVFREGGWRRLAEPFR